MRRAGEGFVGGIHNNSVHTVNAAATAIVDAEARVLQPHDVERRRWGGCWSLSWCFGHQKNNKRISNAVLVPPPMAAVSTNAIVLPFVAPPSSPVSFLPSDPPSATQSPTGVLSLTSVSVNAYSTHGSSSIFSIGPYAYETQLVSPPVFSTFTTEPSTAPITPPPESVHLTTPSSPEVPFAQLLTSSLERTERNNRKLPFSYSDYQHHQLYSGSHGGQADSGTSSPFPGKHPVVEFRIGEGAKLLGFEQFSNRRWGSRLGSGSITPDGSGLSRLGSESLTPNGQGLGSRRNSGSLTPDGIGPLSRGVSVPIGSDIKYVRHLSAAENDLKNAVVAIDPRVLFELTGEDVARALDNKSMTSFGTLSRYPEDSKEGAQCDECKTTTVDGDNSLALHPIFCAEDWPSNSGEPERVYSFQRQRSLTLGSAKDFNFDNRNGSLSRNSSINSEWWSNKKAGGKETKPGNSWSFFPMLQPEVS